MSDHVSNRCLLVCPAAAAAAAADELHSQLAELGVVKDEAHPVLGSLEAQLKSFCTRRWASLAPCSGEEQGQG